MELEKIEKIRNTLTQAAKLIERIEGKRESKFLSFIVISPIRMSTAYKLNKLMRKIGIVDQLDIMIESGGGDLDSTAKIVKILKERSRKIVAVVPFAAKSAASYLALCCDKILFCRSGELGPVDPIVKHPTANIWIPAHSIEEAIKFLESIKDPFVKLTMADKLDPLLMGAYQEAIRETEQYLEEAFEKLGTEKQKEAISTFTTKYRSHGYPIDRNQCRDLGLCVEEPDEDLEEMLMKLHELYIDLFLDLKDEGFMILQLKNDFVVEVGGEDLTKNLKGVLTISESED
ncbi:MAG TPA: hypothetical protein EYP68_02065 [Candidatus Korarchaeota archaeon]|nr:hypothetical protein [Candidatus Korarchaeota archaeon]